MLLAVVRSPLQRSTSKAWCFHPHSSRLGWCSWDCTHPSSSSKHGEWSLYHMTFSHASSGSSRWSLANFRQAWTCAGLKRGTLHALQGFNPWRCSVLVMVTVETVVPALFRSLTSSRQIPHLSQDHDTPRGEILHGAPVRGRLTVILNFLHFLIIAPTFVTFSPSCLPIVL